MVMENSFLVMEDFMKYANFKQGNYVDWCQNGHGVMTWPNGDRYEVFLLI
jgi:hypothetical protein